MKQHKHSLLQSYIAQSKVLPKLKPSSTHKIIPVGAAAFLGVIGGLDAQIVYSGAQNINCVLASNSNRCYANINGAGGNDFEIHRNQVGGQIFIQVDEMLGGGFSINGFHAQVTGGYVYPYANVAGVAIGAAGPWGFNAGQANSLSDNGFYPNHKWEDLPNGTTRYIGIQGTVSGQTKYGWMRLTKNAFGNYTIVDWAYQDNGNTILTGDLPGVGIGTNNPSNLLTVDGNADISGTVSIGKPNASTNLDVEGGIRTLFSGSVVTNVAAAGVQTINLTIGALPSGWTFDNTGVVVTNVDGSLGLIRQAKITASNTIQLNYDALSTGSVRFNYVVFKL